MTEAFHGTVLIPDPRWRIAEPRQRGMKCRYSTKTRCPNPPEYAMHRNVVGRPRAWWLYCAEHCYGHVWLDDGMYFPRELYAFEVGS
jgi:hypothetical protein